MQGSRKLVWESGKSGWVKLQLTTTHRISGPWTRTQCIVSVVDFSDSTVTINHIMDEPIFTRDGIPVYFALHYSIKGLETIQAVSDKIWVSFFAFHFVCPDLDILLFRLTVAMY